MIDEEIFHNLNGETQMYKGYVPCSKKTFPILLVAISFVHLLTFNVLRDGIHLLALGYN